MNLNAKFDPSDVIRVGSLPELYPVIFPSESKARRMVWKREENGLAPAVSRIGRTLYVSKSRLAEILERNEGGLMTGMIHEHLEEDVE